MHLPSRSWQKYVFLNHYVFAFKKLANISFKFVLQEISFFLSQYKTLLRRTDLDILDMRGLYIGIYSSCSSILYSFEYKYIISTNLLPLWSVKFSIGNIFVPIKKREESRRNAIFDVSNWFKSHLNTLSFIVRDFNIE